jgi:hypothetical protein
MHSLAGEVFPQVLPHLVGFTRLSDMKRRTGHQQKSYLSKPFLAIALSV